VVKCLAQGHIGVVVVSQQNDTSHKNINSLLLIVIVTESLLLIFGNLAHRMDFGNIKKLLKKNKNR